MNEFEAINIVWVLGALILAGSALAGYRLNWKRGMVYVLMWASIFVAVTLLINLVNV